MAQIVVMPALGNSVETCLLLSWQVAVGDTVAPNSTLCEIETDKSTIDVPADVSGTVLALLGEEGDEIPVRTPIAVVGEAGENVEEVLAQAGLPPQTAGEGGEENPASQADDVQPDQPVNNPQNQADAQTRTQAQDQAAVQTQSTPDAQPAGRQQAAASEAPAGQTAGQAAGVSPRARNRAATEGISLDSVPQGTGPQGRIIERDVQAAVASGPRPTRGAFGQDLAGAQGSGLGGRVTSEDLAAVPAAPAGQPGVIQSGAGREEFTDIPLKGVRKLIADRMRNALAVSAQLTYDASADATGLLALRKRFKESPSELGFSGITLGDLVCFATVQVLARHANLNAHLSDGTLRTFRAVHLGLAVDTPRGLLVPTIRNADQLRLRELSEVTKQLAETARSGKIDPELLSGATFTVSNLGSFGIESFTPIINVPQTGILGVNTITSHPVHKPDGSIGLQPRIGFSLTADHQVVDGADAGRFLADLRQAVEHIELTVLG